MGNNYFLWEFIFCLRPVPHWCAHTAGHATLTKGPWYADNTHPAAGFQMSHCSPAGSCLAKSLLLHVLCVPPFITPFNSIPISGSASREPGLILFSGSFLSSRETYFQAHTRNLNRHVKPWLLMCQTLQVHRDKAAGRSRCSPSFGQWTVCGWKQDKQPPGTQVQ